MQVGRAPSARPAERGVSKRHAPLLRSKSGALLGGCVAETRTGSWPALSPGAMVVRWLGVTGLRQRAGQGRALLVRTGAQTLGSVQVSEAQLSPAKSSPNPHS